MANLLDEIVAQLTAIVEQSCTTGSRLGYFAALYRLVTLKVQAGIAAGRFQDGARMEQFDVIFANRYLAAYAGHKQGQPVSECWRVAFAAADSWRPIILQQLLLGMNAHINFDLGIAAATVAPGAELAALQQDFNEINQLLAGLVIYVQAEIGAVSPWCWLLDHVGGRTDEAVVNFSIDRARAHAWRVAQRLAPLTPAHWPAEMARLDREVAFLGHLIKQPLGWGLRAGLLVIRARESNDVARVIEVLNQSVTAPV
jgi:hypothetical protein